MTTTNNNTELPKTYHRTPSEIIKELETIPVRKRADWLKENKTFALVTLLQAAYSDKIKFDLPEGAPPYTPDPNPIGYSLQRIDNAIRVMVALTKTSKHTPLKKEQLFIQLLESVSEPDAKMIVAAKDKKFEEIYPILPKKLAEKAFPSLFH